MKGVLNEDDEIKSCPYLRWSFRSGMTKEICSQSYFDHLVHQDSKAPFFP